MTKTIQLPRLVNDINREGERDREKNVALAHSLALKISPQIRNNEYKFRIICMCVFSIKKNSDGKW